MIHLITILRTARQMHRAESDPVDVHVTEDPDPRRPGRDRLVGHGGAPRQQQLFGGLAMARIPPITRQTSTNSSMPAISSFDRVSTHRS